MDLPGRQPSACPRQANTFLYCWAPAEAKATAMATQVGEKQQEKHREKPGAKKNCE